MTHEVRKLEGTELVEVYANGEPVAGPFTPDEATAWVEAQTQNPPARQRAVEEEPEPFEPRGIL